MIHSKISFDIFIYNINYAFMKNLISHLQESLRIGINDSPEDKFIDYTNANNLYLVRIIPKGQFRGIHVDIVTNLRVKLHNINRADTVYEISGDFKFDKASYTNCAFTLNSSGIITRWLDYHRGFDVTFLDILLPPEYLDKFKEFVKSFDDENLTYYIEEVLDMLDIDCDEIPNELNGIEYTLYNKRSNFEKLKQYLHI